MNYKWTIGGSIIGFFAGAFFVLSTDADITANVIGASGPSTGITAIAGIALLVASAGLFIIGVSLEDSVEKHSGTKKPNTVTYASDQIKEDIAVKKEEYNSHQHTAKE